MKPDTTRRSQEIELKLALLTATPSALESDLARTPLLARRKATRQQLHSVYFDTPEQRLRQMRVALRLRRTGTGAKARWVQTLKLGGSDESALSQRGEWEATVPGTELTLLALAGTPWAEIDPESTVFPALVPCFVTTFQRTTWPVRRRDRSVVEVSLDIGQLEVGGQHSPICELEFELIAGVPAALFDVAQQITQTLAVLPASMSKAERGYRLAQGTLGAALRAQPPALTPDAAPREAAQRVIREMFNQFTGNLSLLVTSDAPEVTHQARIGWRRFKSALRLFRPILAAQAPPSWQKLQPLQTFLGELRDLDVALTETLPALAEVFSAGNALRRKKWQTLIQALRQAATLQRKSVRYALMDPAVGATLLSTTQWIEALAVGAAANNDLKSSLRPWARRHIVRLNDRLRVACKNASTPEYLHRARILAKRVRYGIEALRPLLPQKRAQRWYQRAAKLQTRIGAARDVMQAGALASRLDVDQSVVEFLRGYAVGQQKSG